MADIDLRQKCIHLRHNLFAPILLLRHLFFQAMGIIWKRKTLQWKNTKNYYEVKLAESSMFAF
jgi:hypothetical protein